MCTILYCRNANFQVFLSPFIKRVITGIWSLGVKAEWAQAAAAAAVSRIFCAETGSFSPSRETSWKTEREERRRKKVMRQGEILLQKSLTSHIDWTTINSISDNHQVKLDCTQSLTTHSTMICPPSSLSPPFHNRQYWALSSHYHLRSQDHDRLPSQTWLLSALYINHPDG